MAPCSDQSTFSVTSNSTLSQLYFDSENKELRFSVSGASGSTGYINIYIPNSLINDTSDLKIYLDDAPISYAAQTPGEGWLLYATYHHSSHQVVAALGNQQTQPNQTSAAQPLSGNLDLVQTAILVVIGINAATAVIASVRLFSRKEDPKITSN